MELRSAITEVEKLLERGELESVIATVELLLNSYPEEPMLRRILDTARRRQRLMGQGASSPAVAEQRKCPACGATSQVVDSSAIALVCGKCGALSEREETGVFSHGKKVVFERNMLSPTWLHLGSAGSFHGRRFEVVNRTHYKASMMEWDSEDREYYKGSWRWEEWGLLFEDRTILYLIVDEEGASLATPFVPEYPGLPGVGATKMRLHAFIFCRIQEEGTARAVCFEGEFTWVPSAKKVKYAEYVHLKTTYSVVWREQQNKPEELEFFKTVPLSWGQLLKMFGSIPELQRLALQERAKRGPLAWIAIFFATALLLSLGGAFASTGEAVESYQVPSIAALPEDGLVLGPFILEPQGTVYALSVAAWLPDNSSAWLGIELLDANLETINIAQGELWKESGRDSDGPWREQDLEYAKYFRLNQPGVYNLRIFGEAPSIDATARVTLYKNARRRAYWYVSAAAALSWALFLSRIHYRKIG